MIVSQLQVKTADPKTFKPGCVPLPKVPKCQKRQNSSDGTFGTFDTVEWHGRTEVVLNSDQNLHTFFAYLTRPLLPSPHSLQQGFAGWLP